jgi:hypothetical protein
MMRSPTLTPQGEWVKGGIGYVGRGGVGWGGVLNQLHQGIFNRMPGLLDAPRFSHELASNAGATLGAPSCVAPFKAARPLSSQPLSPLVRRGY